MRSSVEVFEAKEQDQEYPRLMEEGDMDYVYLMIAKGIGVVVYDCNGDALGGITSGMCEDRLTPFHGRIVMEA